MQVTEQPFFCRLLFRPQKIAGREALQDERQQAESITHEKISGHRG
jgi:hypothetical protein